MTPEEFQRDVIRTCEPFDSVETQMQFGADYAASEAGELLNKTNKVTWQHHPLDEARKAAIAEELGDVLFGVAAVANALDLTLSQLFVSNAAKRALRYPKGHFTVEDSIARVDAIVEDAHHRAEARLVDLPGGRQTVVVSVPGATIGSQVALHIDGVKLADAQVQALSDAMRVDNE